jgi:hypothetical protein
MSKRRNDLAAAKHRKRKIIAVVGVVLLAVVLVIQVPRTMRMLDSGEAAAPTPAPAEVAGNPADATGAEGIDGTAPTAPASADLVDSNVAPEPGEGDLTSFERFSSKDPFAPQIPPQQESASAPTGALPTAPPADALAGSAPTASTGGSVPDDLAGTLEPARLASAELSVNGKPETVTVGTAFPKGEPTFKLLAVGADSAKIGIVGGGKFASGARAMALERGKPLTLVDTEKGTRYVVILLSVG